MTSINSRSDALLGMPASSFDWRGAGLRYFSYNRFLKHKFGCRVQKVSLDAGFTCPNVDGSITTGGCTFCDNRSFSPSRRIKRLDILDQVSDGIRRLKIRYDCDTFIAYFQPATNTYGKLERLREVYYRALEHPQVVGMAIGTRPDCVPNEVLDLLEEVAGKTYLAVEYGVQTIHDRSLEWMNRGHGYACFPDAMARSRGRGFEICAHIMLGLPGESHDDMLATAREIARQQPDSVKIHNLYAVKKTELADQVARGEVQLMERAEYVRTLVDFLELLPPTMIVERVSGDAPPDYLIGPNWCLDKPGLLNALEQEFKTRDTWQGKLWQPT
ncbi:Oxygen-independent coproporphyrinogen-III oxidase 1 [Anatilimnocola aggregata]|uniref:Oxygen-independent coproporphyrinogen-III oxidase 1 n=2 Tax=Anatilimnocola aggregata TaxID=2528021 RepID=A0A517YER9_9BACT|nr:Oxygen-independent coproporphyrinogen-III oxidase 1 [Anatilimnocola aggregata]